MIKKRKNSIFT